MGDLLMFGSTNLFGCLDDIVVCLIVMFIPCYQGGLNKAKADEREWHFCDCCCWAGNVEYYTRQQLRKKYGLSTDEIMDAILLLFCGTCVTCQHANEMKSKGS